MNNAARRGRTGSRIFVSHSMFEGAARIAGLPRLQVDSTERAV